MRHPFLYGVHSFQTKVTAQDALRLCQLEHTAHLRIVGESLRRHELHQELQILHHLKHYGLQTIVDISNNTDIHRIAQYMREFADILIMQQEDHNFVIEHDLPNENDDARAHRMRTSLRLIEATQEQGANVHGYFYGPFTQNIRPSDFVFRAIIQQACTVV